MRTDRERVALMHRRAAALKKSRDRRRLVLSGACSAVLLAILGAVMFTVVGITPLESGALMTGASLLDESAGGYVLIAVISFAAAVVITMLCMRHQRKNKETLGGNNKEEEIDHEE